MRYNILITFNITLKGLQTKKILILITLLILGIFLNNNSNIYASLNNKSFIDINSPSAVVIDNETGRVLYEKNANEKRAMASLTKVMTSILLVENCKMDEMIEVPAAATWIGGSEVGLKKGDKVSARSLLYGMLLPSGNDCAYTVGLYLGGTIENFAKMMTDKAKEIGLTDTSFANPHGLDDENHYTSAVSMAKIMQYALKNKYINEAVNTTSATINFGSFSKLLNNTNALLRTYEKADGGKTGFINGANRCLVASASDNKSRYIAVVLGANTTNDRFGDTKTILEECFKRYTNMDVSNYLNFYINIPIIKGDINYYEVKISDSMSLPITNEEYDNIYVKQDVVEELTAPIKAGEKIATIEVCIEDEVIYKREMFLDRNIYKKKILDYINEGLSNMFKPNTGLTF